MARECYFSLGDLFMDIRGLNLLGKVAVNSLTKVSMQGMEA